jgi:hypothetical protein
MSTLYLKGLEVALDALMQEAAAPAGTVKLAYMATTYTPDLTNDNYYSDISAEVASGAPTETLANIDVRIDTANSRVEVDADNVTESSITTTTNKFVIYLDTGVAATSPLIACIDIAEGTLTPIAGTLAMTFNAEGIFAVTPT